MNQINRANFAANLNTTTAWTGGAIPTATDIAAWGTPNITTGPSQALGGAVSWQGVLLQSAQTTNISIGTTPAAAMTIGASGIDLSASGANLTIASPVTITLGANQQWSVASGRTLTVSSVITGNAKNVTFAGAGTTVLNTAVNNATWTNSNLIIASGAFVQANANRVLGAITNTVEVQSGGALYITSLQTSGLTVNSFTVAGSGVSGKQAGAVFIASAGDFSSGKTITLQGASPTILLLPNTQAGIIAGTPTGDVTFNITATGSSGATLSSAQDFTVASGSYLVLQGANSTTGAATQADFGLVTSDANPFGAVGNAVKVRSSVRLTNLGAATPVTLSRNYFFEGGATSGTPSSPEFYSVAPVAATGNSFTFTGTITGTSGNWVKTNNNGGSAAHFIQFGSVTGGRLDGSWNLRSFSALQTIRFHDNLDISTWTGNIWVNDVSYGVAPTGAATWNANNTIDNIKGSALTLAHSSLSISAGTVTFTGTDDLSLGTNPITTTGSTTFATLTAGKRLTIPNDIAGSGTLAKSGAGTLTFSGDNTGFTSFSHQAGVLELNSAGSAGPAGAGFVFAATGTTIDSTTGATLKQTGGINLGASSGGFTWKGSADLSMGSGIVTHGGSRTITFVNGATGILTFAGPLNTSTLTYLWNVGSGVAGAKNVLYIANTNASLATTGQVTAGYLRVGKAASLGAVGTSTTWTVSSGAAIELIGGTTTPGTKNLNGVGTGPNVDGVLRSVSGTNKWQGQISISTATGAKIQVNADTFTLDPTGSPAYVGIDAPAGTNTTPITFSAGSGATLNQDRILAAGFSTVTIANGSGTVVLSKANLHSGAMTCSAGTTKLTNIAAVGAGAGNSVSVTAGATMESTVKAVFPATLTLGDSPTAATTFKISA